MSNLKVTKIEGFDALADTRDEWRELFAASAAAPFLSWEWLTVWSASFGTNCSPLILKIYRAQELIGILPLYRADGKICGIRHRKIGLLGDEIGGADYLDIIARRADQAAAAVAALDFLTAEKDFDTLALANLAENSALANAAEKLGRQNVLRYAMRQAEVCPRIDLSIGWNAILKNSRRHSNFKRRLKQLQKFPDFEFRSVTAPDELDAAFARFFELHERRWHKDGGSELSGSAQLAAFQRDVIAKMKDAALLRFDEIWTDGKCRASVYGFDDGKSFYYYNAGYDLDWANLSVGLVLIGLSVKAASERGNEVYDFLRGTETYKFDWATAQTRLVEIGLGQRNFPAIAAEITDRGNYALRDFSKRILPGEFAEKLKTARRKWKRERQISVPGLENQNKVLYE